MGAVSIRISLNRSWSVLMHIKCKKFTRVWPPPFVELSEALYDFNKEVGKGKKVAKVGDGINDAPALVQANIGIAMEAMGTEGLIEAADIVLMQDKLEKVARASTISKRAFKKINENILVGVGVVHIIGITLVLTRESL